MANYTLEIRQMIDNPLIGLFTFDYNFYNDNPKDKEEFEKLFIQWYYFREIGFETPERFKMKLQAKLNVIMPYYRQLALTEWEKVRTVEQMMTSKNLEETSTHEQTITGGNETTTTGNSTAKTTDDSTSSLKSEISLTLNNETTNTQSSTSEVESTDTQNGKASSLSDGVSQASLDNGYLTAVNQTNGTSNQSTTQTGNQTTNQTGNQTTNQTENQTLSGSSNSLSDMNQTTKGNNEQTLKETTTFSSIGDIGIQTPAYAITEWRKVLININQQIIDECRDLFMSIY